MSKLASEQGQKQINQNNLITEKGIILSDEQINEILIKNPKLTQYAKKFSEEEIKTYIINQIPNISQESANKIILKVKT